MHRIRLSTRAIGPGIPYFRPEDRSQAVASLPACRLYVRLVVGPRDSSEDYQPAGVPVPRRPAAVVDTGAPLTLFPHQIWQRFASEIQWLAQPPVAQARRITVLGGAWPYRLGRVRLGATDDEARWLPAVWVNAFFLEPDPGAPRDVVLGLRCRLFDGRQLRQEGPPSGGLRRWWLEDA